MVNLANMTKEGKLLPREDWEKYISSLKVESSNKTIITDEKKAIELLEKPLLDSIKKRLPKKRFGVFFSGGVDSTFIAYICKRYGSDFICYTVGIEGSDDLAESKKAAEEIGFTHRTKTLTLDEMDGLFKKTAKILKGNLDVVSLGVGSVVLAAIEIAKKDKIDTFFGGLGSEEIFAGYERHMLSLDVNEECWTGLSKMWGRDFTRDFAIAESTGAHFLAPFLDKELIIAAMQVSGSLKIKGDEKKYIFRKTAEHLGLPHDISFRPKKAAQYGSRFDSALQKLTKMNGFKFKSQYIEMLGK